MPNTWVDITAHLKTKLRALACYESRLRPMPRRPLSRRDPQTRSVARPAAELRGGGGVRLRAAGQWEPSESRGSRAALRAADGKVLSAYSPTRESLGARSFPLALRPLPLPPVSQVTSGACQPGCQPDPVTSLTRPTRPRTFSAPTAWSGTASRSKAE